MKIRAKLLISFILMAIIAAIIGVIGYSGMSATREAQDAMATIYLPSIEHITDIGNSMTDIKAQEYGLLNRRYNIKERNHRTEKIAKLFKKIEESRSVFQTLSREEEDEVLWKGFLSDYENWLKKHETFMQMVNERTVLMEQGVAGDDEKCTSLDNKLFDYYNTEVRAAFSPCEEECQKIINMQNKDAHNADISADAIAERSTMMLIIIILAGIIFAMVVGIWISGNINGIISSIVEQVKGLVNAAVNGKLDVRADTEKTNFEFREITVGINQTLDAVIRPLNVAAEYVERISKGDIPPKITDEYKGDFNEIKNNLNILIAATNDITEKTKMVANGDLSVSFKTRSENDEMIQSLIDMVKAIANIVGQVQEAADNIASASEEMSANAQQVSQGATEQASAAEEVSSSMEQMSSNIQQNTENSQQTEKISVTASDGITKVNKASGESLTSIREIANKISIISDIAFQTNILALNAAVEAARAGEHGRGFAVVAAEVRKLAERSKVAAEEINELSKKSVNVTEESQQLLLGIMPDIEKTAKLVQEITAASIEQNSGANQINNAINQLNQVTQQNAAAAEEMATSTEELSSQADQLKDMISYFKLEDHSNTRSRSMTSNVKQKQHAKTVETTRTKVAHLAPVKKSTGVSLNLHGHDSKDSDYEKF